MDFVGSSSMKTELPAKHFFAWLGIAVGGSSTTAEPLNIAVRCRVAIGSSRGSGRQSSTTSMVTLRGFALLIQRIAVAVCAARGTVLRDIWVAAQDITDSQAKGFGYTSSIGVTCSPLHARRDREREPSRSNGTRLAEPLCLHLCHRRCRYPNISRAGFPRYSTCDWRE